MKGAVYDLRFVPLDKVVPHEWEDPARVRRLTQTLRQEGILRNPPLVVETPGCYVVLDGTTRTHALRHLGYRDILVQVVETTDPGFRLSSWHHMIDGISGRDILEKLRNMPDIRLQALAPQEASAMLSRRELDCCVILKSVGAFGVLDGAGMTGTATRLNRIVDLYKDSAEIIRVPSNHLSSALDEHPTAEALFAFAHLSHEEILALAATNGRIPPGITRFIIPQRVLGINIDLKLLGWSLSLERKNQLLDAYLEECVSQGKVRLYEEPVLIIEEKKLTIPESWLKESDRVARTAYTDPFG